MSRSVNSFFKKSQAVKQPHFTHDNLSFKLQLGIYMYTHLPRWRKNYTNTVFSGGLPAGNLLILTQT